MGRKWQRIGGKGQLIKTVEGESLRERRAFWTGVRVAVAAAVTALETMHMFPPHKIREFVDDLDLMLIQDNDKAAAKLNSYGIQMAKEPDAPNQPRFNIRQDTNMCHSCGLCEESGGLFYCKILGARFRRSRGRCKSWRGSRAMPADWQRKIMQAGGPPERNEITEDHREWLEMMDEIRTGQNV